MPEREERKFWVSHDGVVQHLSGFDCKPNEGWWFFPAIGYSLCENTHCWTEKQPALDHAREECERQISAWQLKLKYLNAL